MENIQKIVGFTDVKGNKPRKYTVAKGYSETVKEFGKIAVSLNTNDKFPKDGLTSYRLEQEVITTVKYHSSNGLDHEIDGPSNEIVNVSKRVVFVNLDSVLDIGEITTLLDSLDSPIIHQILSNQPILDRNQRYMLDNQEDPSELLDSIKKRQLIPGTTNVYRRLSFRRFAIPDEDLRT